MSEPQQRPRAERVLGANAWLIDELYAKYVQDPSSVDRAWWDFFADYEPLRPPALTQSAETDAANAAGDTPSDASLPAGPPASDTTPTAEPAPPAGHAAMGEPIPYAVPAPTAPNPRHRPHAVDLASAPTPAPRVRPASAAYAAGAPATLAEPGQADAAAGESPLRGAAGRAAANMDASLGLPTATSMRQIPAKVLIENRILINEHLARGAGGRVSVTHLIAFAMAEALREMPDMNTTYRVGEDSKPRRVRHEHVGLGLAIDVQGRGGERQLLVPCIKEAETLPFGEFWAAYEDLVRRSRTGKLTVDDFQGTTASLTNPGGLGTVASVPRLMPGQATIIGVGAMTYPAEFQGASEATLTELGVSKRMTLTSTYDHRVIQGALSGEFLALMETKLAGRDGFYDRIFASLRIPYEPWHWERDRREEPGGAGAGEKAAHVSELIHAYRVRGHYMADLDPLAYRQRGHEDLSLAAHGLSMWDLDREFPTGGLAGRATMKLREILHVLRDAYCRTLAVEYMHIEDPAQRTWFARRLERSGPAGDGRPSPEEQRRVLARLGQAEALETFLQTKYLGAKRFSLEGSEAMIPTLDEIVSSAAADGAKAVAIGMPHRGRLAALTLVAGKSYSQVFAEFEDKLSENPAATGPVTEGDGMTRGRTPASDPDAATPNGPHRSGDVKYHLGTEGVYVSTSGAMTLVQLAANPSHLEAVDGVLEGMARAQQDLLPEGEAASILPVLIHGDAAFAGQGVIMETLNLAQLRGYGTHGTIHVVVNNQIGFTTGTWNARSTAFPTDVAKGYGCPVIHANGDDPEACLRAARLAYEYRQEFHHDVVIDIVGYRRRGHNEGDDPSMTQPVMYSLIGKKRSVRKLYTEALLARGDITVEEAEAALRDFHAELERALAETRSGEVATDAGPARRPGGSPQAVAPSPTGGRESGSPLGEQRTSGERIPMIDAARATVDGFEVPAAQTADAGLMVGWSSSAPAGLLARVGQAHVNPPAGFHLHPKMA
ncbi:MAG: multifunctional oxoglutarate decarboxylase/oxoglutarate dehydrogenase thiamine pyrophosphate-binding subunit/dihydrolipoyllysine-residue succinyltransferase subunit, partial [Bifidobacteriaceae bacterium]|nr:multifunctional oxoglutarate decarboxylase/oxoglutarate dehydrogenase thiamine pyrophosphate-binding subunit/dihydrolipoyllysine-residue succinyltransferase subunit [Bifidobacteriaceae bacterium]